MSTVDGFSISGDPWHLDVDIIHRYLAGESHWAAGLPRRVVEKAIADSPNFGFTPLAEPARWMAIRRRPRSDGEAAR